MTHTDPETARCPYCPHPAHRPGVECEGGVDHGPKHWHRCLCLNLIGSEAPCHPLMDCQGGKLGYSDIWYLQRGHTLSSADGPITPDVLTSSPAVSGGVSPATDEAWPSRRAGLRDEIATALEAADYRMDMRRGDLADAVLSVLYREWPWLRAEAEDAVLPATTTHTDRDAADRGAKAEALLLHFTAEAHRRKWNYDRGLDDDGVPIKSEAFDALHQLGEDMRVALEKLRREPATAVGAGAATTPDIEPVCVCGHPMRLHHEDVCLTNCGCNDGLDVEAAASEIDRLRQAATRARAEGAIEALRSAAEHVHVGVAVGPIPFEVRPAVQAWLNRLAQQRRDKAITDAAARAEQKFTKES